MSDELESFKDLCLKNCEGSVHVDFVTTRCQVMACLGVSDTPRPFSALAFTHLVILGILPLPWTHPPKKATSTSRPPCHRPVIESCVHESRAHLWLEVHREANTWEEAIQVYHEAVPAGSRIVCISTSPFNGEADRQRSERDKHGIAHWARCLWNAPVLAVST